MMLPFPLRMKYPRILTAVLALSFLKASAATDQWVYIGTYTQGSYSTGDAAPLLSKGIYLLGLDSQTGKLEELGPVGGVLQPAFLAIHPSKKYLYAVSEFDGGGQIHSFQIDPANGHLTPLNSQATLGDATCHVNIDATGKMAVVASYSNGTVASFPIKEDGSLAPIASLIRHSGGSHADEDRQEDPHAHSVNFDKGNKFAFAADLGCDKIFIYKMDPATAALIPNDPPFVATPPAGGPRHFAFHPSGKFAYVTNEMACTITSFTYDADKGALKMIETLSELPAGVSVIPEWSSAEVQVHPSGKFVYASVRGHNTLACYKVDEATGKLTYLENAPAGVKIPRNFGIDPTGHWLISAGFDSDSVVIFSIDAQTGKLTPTGQSITIPQPVCVKFLKRS